MFQVTYSYMIVKDQTHVFAVKWRVWPIKLLIANFLSVSYFSRKELCLLNGYSQILTCICSCVGAIVQKTMPKVLVHTVWPKVTKYRLRQSHNHLHRRWNLVCDCNFGLERSIMRKVKGVGVGGWFWGVIDRNGNTCIYLNFSSFLTFFI